MKPIDVCLSPELMHLYDVRGRAVVVVDILRATSSMVTAFGHGVDHITPFADAERCRSMKSAGYLISGERNGITLEGFDKGNSPFEYKEEMEGKKIAFTTTNGTVAIEKSFGAKEIMMGAFLNLSAVAEKLRQLDLPVLIVCAGWKGKVNMEDSVFAGALVEKLKNEFEPECDTPLMAQHLFLAAKENLAAFLSNSSHVKRLNKLNAHDDFEYCLRYDVFDVVPVLREGALRL